MEEGSLAQAFLAAGAGVVVATLWRVGDAAAADLAERFYRHLGPGISAAEALARSQREAIGSRTGSDWAAYAVWGHRGAQDGRGCPC
jgi:CHAT domain-containing protein